MILYRHFLDITEFFLTIFLLGEDCNIYSFSQTINLHPFASIPSRTLFEFFIAHYNITMVADSVHDYSAALLCAGMKDFTKLHLEGVLSFTQGFELSKNFFHTLILSLRRSGSNIMHLKGSSSSISSSKDPNTQAKWIVTGSYDTVTSQGDLMYVQYYHPPYYFFFAVERVRLS